MPRRYVIVAPDFVQTGGMDRANYALARHVARCGHETHLVSFRVAADLTAEPNVRVHLAPRPLGKFLLGAPFLGSVAAAESLRLLGDRELVANGGNCLVPGAVNWVHYVHAGASRWYPAKPPVRNLIAQATERIALRRARLIIANSERTRRELVEYVGVDDAKVRVVYLGVDPAEFRPREESERSEIRARLAWDVERPKVVFVGELADKRKGFETLYAAWRTLCRSPDWDADLVVVGAGRLVRRYVARARADGIDTRIKFLGFRKDVQLIVGACDVLVAPSSYEPYGLAVHEALCSAVPAITSARSGVAEVYPDALAELLLPDPEDDLDLARRLVRWRSAPRVHRSLLGELSDRLRARDWDTAAREILALCEA